MMQCRSQILYHVTRFFCNAKRALRFAQAEFISAVSALNCIYESLAKKSDIWPEIRIKAVRGSN